MITIHDILALAAKIPPGLPDDGAVEGLLIAMQNLDESLGAVEDGFSTLDGVFTEIADVVYFAAKAMQYAAYRGGIDVATALEMTQAKYQLRARPGFPEDPKSEWRAIAAVYKQMPARQALDESGFDWYGIHQCPDKGTFVEVLSRIEWTALYASVPYMLVVIFEQIPTKAEINTLKALNPDHLTVLQNAVIVSWG